MEAPTQPSAGVLALKAKLEDHKHINRIAAVEEIGNTLASHDKPVGIEEELEGVVLSLCKEGRSWEGICGALLASKPILHHHHPEEFCSALLDVCKSNLDNPEVRVRLAVAEVLGSLCQIQGPVVFGQVAALVTELIDRGLGLHIDNSQVAHHHQSTKNNPTPTPNVIISSLPQDEHLEQQAHNATNQNSSTVTNNNTIDNNITVHQHQSDLNLHDQQHDHTRVDRGHVVRGVDQTHEQENVHSKQICQAINGKESEPARSFLESSMIIVRCCMEGSGEKFGPFVTPYLLLQLRRSCDSPNYFVRETAFVCFHALIESSSIKLLERICDSIVSALGIGLEDNWSPVRFAASTATRAFVVKAVSCRAQAYPTLIPRMCLNRHYVADGVRIYSIDTWKLVVEGRGKEVLGEHVGEAVAYYVQQTRSPYFAVRATACHCIAELAVRVDVQLVLPHVATLLDALVAASHDPNCSVRDAVCSTAGDFLLATREACSTAAVDQLYVFWFKGLADFMCAVREQSAVALRKALEAQPQAAMAKLTTWLDSHILDVLQQPVETFARGELSRQITRFGITCTKTSLQDLLAQAQLDQKHSSSTSTSTSTSTIASPTLAEVTQTQQTHHHDHGHQQYQSPPQQQQESKAEAAARLRHAGGCGNHNFVRQSKPWEYSDGALHLLREISATSEGKARLSQYMDSVATVARARHFAHHVFLQETLWRSVREFAVCMGASAFYKYAHELVCEAVSSLGCGHGPTEKATAETLLVFQKMYGKDDLYANLTPQEVQAIKSNVFMTQPRSSKRAGAGGV